MKQQYWKKQLGNNKLKTTKARLAVLEILEAVGKPLDVSEIESELTNQSVTADNATVYRILDIFVDKNLVQRIEFQEGKFRYEISGRKHHHLICENCGKIKDVNDCPVVDLEASIAKKHKFVIKRHALEFFGLCEDCQ